MPISLVQDFIKLQLPDNVPYVKSLNTFELIGVIIGDGSIWYYPKKHVYAIEISGNSSEDLDYMKKISRCLSNLSGKSVQVKIKTEKNKKCAKVTVYGKAFVKHIMQSKGITNVDKTFRASVKPEYREWRIFRHIVRGIFETDGCIYFSKSGGKIGYPRIEIKTSSVEILNQILDALRRKNFKPRVKIAHTGRTYEIYLSGPVMLEKWASEIGFGSYKNLTKYLFWKKFGYYVPRMKVAERISRTGVQVA